MKELSIQSIIELVFTTENPETGSKPPANIAYAIFENETICLITPNEKISLGANTEELSKFAKEALQDLGVAIGGTSSADFNVSRVPWFSEEYVYMITYDSPRVFSVKTYKEETEDLVCGLAGRSSRSQDAEDLTIKLIRDFEGNLYEF